ncbi:class I SAM-dependent methyltransferase [Nitrosomonas sp.]|uniref:class I SAM-dependent methyltransferase n=1 Tax=Nitrosomonas sp. TaxID=42353 RepID=UPI002625224E|nr:class I SAM-dependent methyltransferase [Nitrosomonas sp.]MCW5600404.1 class I SAM-dependent methyltransferase [Nitrosomonas sp.]
MKKQPHYIPALHFHWLTRWYDPMMKYLFHDEALKKTLVNQTYIQSGQTVLDMGCGTGTLSLMIKQSQPNAKVHGLDIDPQILDMANKKVRQTGSHIDLQQGSATCLPYPNESFDHVFASLVLHHLTRQDKQQALKEAFRVLKAGGKLHVMDFGEPHNAVMWSISWLTRWFEEVYDHVLGLLPVYTEAAGFQPVEEITNYHSILGTVVLYHTSKP